MNAIRGIGMYLLNCLKSIAAIPWSVLSDLLKRIFLFLYHLVSGLFFLGVGLYLNFQLLFTQIKKWPKWFGKVFISIVAWIGRLVSKILDMVMVGEILDLVFQVLKPNSRSLSDTELTEAKKVYGDGLRYWQIRIDEYSLIAKLGALFAGSKNMGVTTFHTINFTRKIVAAPGNGDMDWLIHELAHVCQMQHVGIQYLVEALVAQYTGGYNYGGTEALKGKTIHDFNREQQADIAADYYTKALYGNTPVDYFMPIINEFRNANGLWVFSNLVNR